MKNFLSLILLAGIANFSVVTKAEASWKCGDPGHTGCTGVCRRVTNCDGLQRSHIDVQSESQPQSQSQSESQSQSRNVKPKPVKTTSTSEDKP